MTAGGAAAHHSGMATRRRTFRRAESSFARGYKTTLGVLAALVVFGGIGAAIAWKWWQMQQTVIEDWQASVSRVRLIGDNMQVTLAIRVDDSMGGIVALKGQAMLTTGSHQLTLTVDESRELSFSGETEIRVRMEYDDADPEQRAIRLADPAAIDVRFTPERVQLPDGRWASVRVERPEE